jgi:tetratricopeptide (TPR) repeat protein
MLRLILKHKERYMRPVSILFTLLLVTLFGAAQSFQQALTLLNDNKRTEAKTALTALESDAATAGDAALAMVLLESSNEHWDDAFAHFQKFFNGSQDPYPYVYALWNTGLFSRTEKATADVKKMMEKITADPKANATIKAMAWDNLAGSQQAKGDIKQSKETWNRMGDVKGWSTVGVFENMSTSGFNKDYGVLAHPEAGFGFKNNRGAGVNWFNIPDARNDRWLDFEYHYDINNSIIYAQTFISSDADKDVTMMFGVSGSFKIWINDFIVAQEAEERNTDIDVYNYQVKLQKGYNRILVQVGSSEITNSNFLLRFVGADGLVMPITGLPTLQTYNKAQPYEVKKVAMFAENFFENRLAKNANSFLDMVMLVNTYNHNDKRFESRKIAAQLKATAPKSTIVSEKIVETYARDNNNTDLTKEIEFVKSNDPESLYGIALLYNDAVNKEDYTEAQLLLGKRMATYGKNEETQIKTMDLMGKRKEIEKLLKEMDYAYNAYPGNRTFMVMQYGLMQNVSKDMKKGNALLLKYLEDHYDEEIMETVSSNLMKLGKKEEGMKMLKKMIEDKPFAVGRMTSLSDKYYDQQDYKTALEWQQKAINLAPYVGGMHYTKALILDAQGNKAEAKTELKKAIEFNPNNYEARKKLRELEGRKDLFSSFKTEDINALVKNNIKQADYPNDNSIYLLNEMQQVVYPESGASEERNELLIKILNQSGIDDWKELSLPYNSYTQRLIIDKAELFKKDGSKVQAETNNNQLVFSSLEIGDVLHISYKLESSSYGKLAEHFWEDFMFNGGYPIKVARYSLLVPKDKKFQYKMYNTGVKPIISDVDDYKLHVWEKLNSPGVTGETNMPPFTDVAERVVVTSIPDWNYVANWYSDLSSIKAKGDFEVKEKAKEIFEGKKNLTDLQKAKVIYDYIESNFNYSAVPFLHSALTPQRASRTITTRLGDCKDLSTLFVALGKEVGLDANLVLVDTRDNGDMNLDLPTIGFNHCIAQLKTGDKNYLIELTNNHLPFGALGYGDLGANGLYIPKEGERAANAALVKLNTPNRPVNYIDRISTVTFVGNNVEVERVAKKIGAEASVTRGAYKDQGEEDRNKGLLKSLSGEFNKKVNLKTFSMTNLDNLKDTVDMNYKFSIEGFSSEIVGMQIFKLPWSDSYGSLDFVSLETRNYPFNIWSFSSTNKDKEVMTIVLPTGKKLAEAPKNVSISCPAMSYELSFKTDPTKPGRIIATREVKYLKEQVPVTEYAAFKEFISKMGEADSKQLGFK